MESPRFESQSACEDFIAEQAKKIAELEVKCEDLSDMICARDCYIEDAGKKIVELERQLAEKKGQKQVVSVDIILGGLEQIQTLEGWETMSVKHKAKLIHDHIYGKEER
jgi:hypothetical protein